MVEIAQAKGWQKPLEVNLLLQVLLLLDKEEQNFFPGENIGLGRDHTLFSKIDGIVSFDWASKGKRRLNVYTEEKVKN